MVKKNMSITEAIFATLEMVIGNNSQYEVHKEQGPADLFRIFIGPTFGFGSKVRTSPECILNTKCIF